MLDIKCVEKAKRRCAKESSPFRLVRLSEMSYVKIKLSTGRPVEGTVKRDETPDTILSLQDSFQKSGKDLDNSQLF